MARFAVIGIIAVGAVAFFGYQLYRNMGKGSKAVASGTVTITMSNSVTGTVPVGTTFTVGVTLAANTGNTMSAVDLVFTDPQDALNFVLPTESFQIENQSVKAFDETVRLATTVRGDGSRRLDRITLVARRSTANLKSTATLRLRFKARSTTAASYPSVVSFRMNTGSSVITGPGINNNKFSLTPSNASLSITLGCSSSTACMTGQVCYKSICRTPCGTNGSCAGAYHCESGACVPGIGGGSSSSAGQAPTATPYPTARPDKANLFMKVKMPDVATGVAVAQVRIQVREGSSPVTELVTDLRRKTGSDIFETGSPLELDIPAGPAKQYTLFVKQLKTIRRSFTITLQRGETKNCIAGDSSCVGSLKNPELAPLLSGDSDGFNDGSNGTQNSASYNKINNVDLDRLVEGYDAGSLPPEPNADFNLDGNIDVHDLGILGRNYNKTGE